MRESNQNKQMILENVSSMRNADVPNKNENYHKVCNKGRALICIRI